MPLVDETEIHAIIENDILKTQQGDTVKRKKLIPTPLLILIDVVLIGAFLCVYALFHHVLNGSFRNGAGRAADTPVRAVSVLPTPNPVPTTVPVESEGDGEPVVIDYGQFGEQFKEKFAAEGELVQTETLYMSHDIRVELSDDRMFDSDVHIVDIYVRNIENLRTTFAGGSEVFDGTRARVLDMAEREHAVAALNGDYAGFMTGGEYVVLRNGVYFYSRPTRAVCVLYYDGRMETYWKPFNQTGDDFDLDEAMANGAWQIWSFGPALLDEDGHANTLYDANVYNPRSVLGYYEPGHYCFITVDGRSSSNSGMNLDELAAMCESYGLTQAFNLDGGGSSTLIFGGECVSYGSPNEPQRAVTDCIYIAETDGSIPSFWAQGDTGEEAEP